MSSYRVTFTNYYLYPGGCIELDSYDEVIECDLTEIELTTLNLSTCEVTSEWVDVGELCCAGVPPVGTAVDPLILEFSEINTTTCEIVEQSCEYMDECPPDLYTGLCCGCDSVPRFWQVEISGVVNDTDGTLCDFANGTWILWYYFDDVGYNCYWKSTAVMTCPGGDYGAGHGTICQLRCVLTSGLGFRWIFQFSYCYNFATSTCFQPPSYVSDFIPDICARPLTLDITPAGPDYCCTGWPATITLVAL